MNSCVQAKFELMSTEKGMFELYQDMTKGKCADMQHSGATDSECKRISRCGEAT